MPQLNKVSKSEKEILPDLQSVEFESAKQEKEVVSHKEVKELNKLEIEKLRQEVLEEVDISEKPSKKIPPQAPSPLSTTVTKSPVLLNIESVMEDGLDNIFLKMDVQLQEKFKQEGEKTATAINDILQSGKIEARKIFKLILKWLKIIPGVNKFFLKQESKIKTDKIININ